MTEKEREKLIRAIRFLTEDEDMGGDFYAGMNILMRLAGLETTFFFKQVRERYGCAMENAR